MELEHRFTVPAAPDVVWNALIDPQRVAPCMPGASLTEVSDNAFSGTVKVRIGPVSLQYAGSGEFVETDAPQRRAVIRASGKDTRGNGTAAATVTLRLHDTDGDGAPATEVTVSTDLSVTGKPAQFGRGMISEVSGRILDTFAGCLATALAPSTATEPPPATGTGDTGTGVDGTGVDGAAPPDKPPGTPIPAVTEPAPAPGPAEDRPAAVAAEPEPLDLLDYAGPTVARRVIPALLALVVVLLIIRRLRR